MRWAMTDDTPICDVTGEAVEDCDHVAVDAYDEVEAANERLDREREER